jgi:hypothetical protein
LTTRGVESKGTEKTKDSEIKRRRREDEKKERESRKDLSLNQKLPPLSRPAIGGVELFHGATGTEQANLGKDQRKLTCSFSGG